MSGQKYEILERKKVVLSPGHCENGGCVIALRMDASIRSLPVWWKCPYPHCSITQSPGNLWPRYSLISSGIALGMVKDERVTE